jgi:hypothetical protein
VLRAHTSAGGEQGRIMAGFISLFRAAIKPRFPDIVKDGTETSR